MIQVPGPFAHLLSLLQCKVNYDRKSFVVQGPSWHVRRHQERLSFKASMCNSFILQKVKKLSQKTQKNLKQNEKSSVAVTLVESSNLSNSL
jgi:hypothetical protein